MEGEPTHETKVKNLLFWVILGCNGDQQKESRARYDIIAEKESLDGLGMISCWIPDAVTNSSGDGWDYIDCLACLAWQGMIINRRPDWSFSFRLVCAIYLNWNLGNMYVWMSVCMIFRFFFFGFFSSSPQASSQVDVDSWLSIDKTRTKRTDGAARGYSTGRGGCGEWIGFPRGVPRFAQETWQCSAKHGRVRGWGVEEIIKLAQGKRGTSWRWRDNGWMVS